MDNEKIKYMKIKETVRNKMYPAFEMGDWVVVKRTDTFYFNCDKGFAQRIYCIK